MHFPVSITKNEIKRETTWLAINFLGICLYFALETWIVTAEFDGDQLTGLSLFIVWNLWILPVFLAMSVINLIWLVAIKKSSERGRIRMWILVGILWIGVLSYHGLAGEAVRTWLAYSRASSRRLIRSSLRQDAGLFERHLGATLDSPFSADSLDIPPQKILFRYVQKIQEKAEEKRTSIPPQSRRQLPQGAQGRRKKRRESWPPTATATRRPRPKRASWFISSATAAATATAR